MRKFAALVIGCFIGLAVPVAVKAQQASTNTPLPDALAKAQELLKVEDVEKVLVQAGSNPDIIATNGVFLIGKIDEANKGQEERVKQVVIDVVRNVAPKVVPDFMQYETNLYATAFTPQELDEMIAFYQTDNVQQVQKMMEDLSVNPNAPRPSQEQLSTINSYFVTGAGSKFKTRLEDISRKTLLYRTDVMRKKERDLIYAQLREELPKNNLKIPDPFTPDTFIDQPLHNRAAAR